MSTDTVKNEAANNNRRFTFMVEDSLSLDDNNGILVTGNLHGRLAVDDAAYIFHPNGQITLTTVHGIESNNAPVREAENQTISIKLADIKDKSLVQKYSVLTSIRPQHVINVNQAVENGQLLGLSMEFKRFCKESDYMSLFVYAVCHAHFLSPVYMSKEPKDNGDGTATFTEGSTLRFLTLNSPADKTKHHLPVFTDSVALQKWKIATGENQPPKSMILRFPDVVTISKKNMDGAVINPFGPVPVLLPGDYIEKITSLAGYKAEFENKENQNAKPIMVEQDTKILLGIPAANEEVTAIREAIATAVIPNVHIIRVYMLLKMDEKQEKSYLMVVDCDRDAEIECFNLIGSVVRPYLKQVKYIEMISYERFGDKIKNMKEKSIIFDRATFWK